MIALDIAPYYNNAEYVQKVELIADYDFSKPKTRKTSDLHPYLMTQPEKVDFRKPVNQNSNHSLL
jgi:hypothetical protein